MEGPLGIPPAPSFMSSRKTWFLMLVAVIVVAGVIYAALRFLRVSNNTPAAQNENASLAASDLGTALFAKAQNPLQGELPEQIATMENLLGELYQNPFR